MFLFTGYVIMGTDTKKLDEYFEQIPMPNDINEASIELIRNWIKAQHHLPRTTGK